MTQDRQSLRAVLRERFPRNHGQLLPALHFLHHEFGYLSDWAMEVVGWHLGIPASEVYGAATSYSELRVAKTGNHILRVCVGLGCSVNGSKELIEAIESELRVHPGMTTPDGNFTFEEVPCAYLCGMAPAVELDGSWKGNMTPESVKAILKEVSQP